MIPKHTFKLLLLFCLATMVAKGQMLDSLLTELHKKKKADTLKLDLLCKVAYEYQYVSPEKGLVVADTAVTLAKQLNNANGLAHAYLLKGVNYFRSNNYKDAKDWIQQSSGIYAKTGNVEGLGYCFNYAASIKNSQADYPGALADFKSAIDLLERCANKTDWALAIRNMAITYTNVADYPAASACLEKAIAMDEKLGNNFALADALIAKADVAGSLSDLVSALGYIQKALRIFERIGYKSKLSQAYRAVGFVYFNMSNLPKALEYQLKALSTCKEQGDAITVAKVLADIAASYRDSKNYTKAMEYYEQALAIFEAKGYSDTQADLLQSIGLAYFNQGDYLNAFKYYKRGLGMAQQLGIKYDESIILLLLGEFYLNVPDSVITQNGVSPQHRYDTAAAYLTAGNKLAKDFGGVELQRDAWEDLSTMYQRRRDFANALDAYKKYIVLRDSVLNDEKNQKISNLAMQYEFDKKTDSVQLVEQITDEKLKQQVLLAKQQEQQLELGKKELALITQEKDLQRIAYLKTQADLQNDQLEKADKEKLLIIAAKEKKLQQASTARERYSNRVSLYGLLALLGFLAVIAFMLWRNNLSKQKANTQLWQQEHETKLQKEKAEKALEELKTTQSQLVQSEKMASFGELTAGIAHEIQNPLNFVNNFSEVNTELIDELAEEISNGDAEKVKLLVNDIKQNMQKINQHGKRADGIVKAMLQHSRASTGKKELTNINALADEYLRLSYHGFRAKGKGFTATIETDFDKNIVNINIMAQDVSRVLLNLFNNAFYSVDEKSRHKKVGYQPAVSISTKKIESLSGKPGIELRIRDNGMGIPEKVLNKIFQPFFTTKPTGQGTGLGLSLSYDIITKGNGGTLTVFSQEGEYAEFIVQLPIS